jgi:hypothetical protein
VGVCGCEWGCFVGRLGVGLVGVWLLGVLKLCNVLITILGFWGLGLCLVCGCGMILV